MTKSILKSTNGNSIRRRLSTGSADSDNSEIAGVCWDDITIHEFPSILGDNPAVTNGAPLTLSWERVNSYKVDVNVYEYMRSTNYHRSRKQLMMKCGERDAYLLGIGYSLEELIKSSEECRQTRESRRANMGNNTWAKKLMVGMGTNKLMHGMGAAATKGLRFVGMNNTTISTSSKNLATAKTTAQPRIKVAKSA